MSENTYQRQWRLNNPDYHRNWVKANPDKKYNERMYDYQKRNRDKKQARDAVYYALKTGKLVRPSYCSACLDECVPEADHHDYSKKLDVTWLCRPCHLKVTMQRKK